MPSPDRRSVSPRPICFDAASEALRTPLRVVDRLDRRLTRQPQADAIAGGSLATTLADRPRRAYETTVSRCSRLRKPACLWVRQDLRRLAPAMLVKGVSWIGTRTDRFDDMVSFVERGLELPTTEREPGRAAFELDDGSLFEVFAPEHHGGGHPPSGVVAGFEAMTSPAPAASSRRPVWRSPSCARLSPGAGRTSGPRTGICTRSLRAGDDSTGAATRTRAAARGASREPPERRRASRVGRARSRFRACRVPPARCLQGGGHRRGARCRAGLSRQRSWPRAAGGEE